MIYSKQELLLMDARIAASNVHVQQGASCCLGPISVESQRLLSLMTRPVHTISRSV